MICGVVKASTLSEMHQRIHAVQNLCEMMELRLDYLIDLDFVSLAKLLKTIDKPVIFTLRTLAEGGNFKGTHEQYLNILNKLIPLEPHYLDVETHVTPQEMHELRSVHPQTKILLSFHDFKKMPNLDQVYQEMQKTPADLYKIAILLNSSVDTLDLLDYMKEHSPKLVAMGIGKFGEVTRILSPVFGGAFVFSSLNTQGLTVPGQLTIYEFEEVYNYHHLNTSSAIYGLIGNPVVHSIGHLTHNKILHALDMAAVYVKFPVTEEELPKFLEMAKKVGMRGLSVTMPLKEIVMNYIDDIDPKAKRMGAVNTLVFEHGKIKGYNTDGNGALDALEAKIKVKGKKVVIIGAGGASKAVAYEAIERGARVVILNRNAERAEFLAQAIGCEGAGLDKLEQIFKEGYDVIINATPTSMPINPDLLLPKAAAMDLQTKPRYTEFLQHADQKGCPLVFGYEMFVGQALGQFELWFGNEFYKKTALKMLGETVVSQMNMS